MRINRRTAGATHQPDAGEFLSGLVDELSSGPLNLPCFPDIVARVRQALADPRCTTGNIVKIVGTEPRLAARLIQTANSAVFNPNGLVRTSLGHAVTRLGSELVQSVATAFAIQQMKLEPSLRGVARPLQGLWERSLAVASICRVLAERLHVPVDKVFLSGLLHGIGHFYILVRTADGSCGLRYEQLDPQLVANWHPTIGRAVLEKWGFDAAMCRAVGSQSDYQHRARRAADLTDVLIVSVALADTVLEHEVVRASWESIQAFASLKMKPDETLAILKHTEHTLSSLREALGA